MLSLQIRARRDAERLQSYPSDSAMQWDSGLLSVRQLSRRLRLDENWRGGRLSATSTTGL